MTATEGAGRPTGAQPADALAQAERAFALGNFAEVRRLCRPLLTADSNEVAAAARRLHRRVSVDPVQIAVVVLCLGLLGWIVARYVL